MVDKFIQLDLFMGSYIKNGFIVHIKFIASYGCMMKRNGEEIVCTISYTNLWYCVNGIISSTVKKSNSFNIFIGIFF